MSSQTYTPSTDPLIAKVAAYVKIYMAQYDASHDFHHIQRVVGLASHITSTINTPSNPRPLNPQIVELSALLHDVGDKKYINPNDPDFDPADAVRALLVSLGAEPDLAATVQEICLAVSWKGETADPERVQRVLARHPELAAVQDADRLDAIGAVGLGRLFTFGGAKTGRSLGGSMEHLDEKLLRIQERLKTEEGRRIGRDRTDRLLMFKGWFGEETAFAAASLGDDGVEPAP